jgi:large subunit ribosomal protein L13
MVVIDADGAVVGRLGARVAKLLLAGQHVDVVNADKALMLGSLSATKDKFLRRRSMKNKRNPDESPKYPRSPHLMLRRMVRGMLPHKSQRGRDAYALLHVFSSTMLAQPKEGKVQKIKEASSEAKHGTFTLTELCRELGGNV